MSDETRKVEQDLAEPGPAVELPEAVEGADLALIDKDRAIQIAGELDASDAQTVMSFGARAQSSLVASTEAIVAGVKTHSVGPAGELLNELLMEIRDADVDSMSGTLRRVLSKMPLVGQLFDEVRSTISSFEPVEKKIDATQMHLERQKMVLLTDIENLSRLFEDNKTFVGELDTYIAAGKLKARDLGNELAGLRAEAGSDPMRAQEVQDMARAIDRLEIRVHDLELTRMMAIQMAPQIRIVQDSNERLATKIQTAVLTTIPLWKTQVAMAIVLMREKAALDTMKGVTDTTNELLQKNSEMLKQGTLDIRRETERGVVDIETLQKVNTDIITTIQEAIRISEEGRAKRAQSEAELVRLETELKAALAENRDRF